MTASAAPGADRVLTVPNALSILRLLGVPVFLWLLLGPHADGWAITLVALASITDWADGVLARKLNQTSELGALLDPFVDRLYILATLFGLALRHIIPWWLVIVLVARDLILGLALLPLRRRGYGPPEVHYLGKAATFCLLYAFPLLLVATYVTQISGFARPLAWAFTSWGTALYLWAGGLYLMQVRRVLRTAPA